MSSARDEERRCDAGTPSSEPTRCRAIVWKLVAFFTTRNRCAALTLRQRARYHLILDLMARGNPRGRLAWDQCVPAWALLLTSSLGKCIAYSYRRANRKQDSGGYTPFLSVSHAAARPHTPFLLGGTVSIDGTCNLKFFESTKIGQKYAPLPKTFPHSTGNGQNWARNEGCQ